MNQSQNKSKGSASSVGHHPQHLEESSSYTPNQHHPSALPYASPDMQGMRVGALYRPNDLTRFASFPAEQQRPQHEEQNDRAKLDAIYDKLERGFEGELEESREMISEHFHRMVQAQVQAQYWGPPQHEHHERFNINQFNGVRNLPAASTMPFGSMQQDFLAVDSPSVYDQAGPSQAIEKSQSNPVSSQSSQLQPTQSVNSARAPAKNNTTRKAYARPQLSNEQLDALPNLRAIPYRLGYNHAGRALKRTGQHRGIKLATKGYLAASACDDCKAGFGPFNGCFVETMGGATTCANCTYRARPCSLTM